MLYNLFFYIYIPQLIAIYKYVYLHWLRILSYVKFNRGSVFWKASLLISPRCVSVFHAGFLIMAALFYSRLLPSHFPCKLSKNIAALRALRLVYLICRNIHWVQGVFLRFQPRCYTDRSTDFAHLILYSVSYTCALLCIGNHFPILYFSLQFGL